MASKPASKNKDDLKRNDLGYLGIEFQEKLVKVFFEDKTFFENIQSIVDQNMFTSEHLRRIVGIMKNRYSSASTPPSYDEVKLLIRMQVTDAITVELLEGVVDKLRDMPLTSVDIIESQCENFFKQQNLVKAMNKAMDIVRQGDFRRYPQIEGLMQDALAVNSRQDYGFHLFENVEKTLSEDYRQTIPTGCLELDKALYGGIGRRELGVIVAPMGVGKAMPLHSKVLTPTGFRTMGEIEVGDMVIGGDGNPYKVIGTFPQGVRPVYRLTFSNGAVVECDENHLWNVYCSLNECKTIEFSNILKKWKEEPFASMEYPQLMQCFDIKSFDEKTLEQYREHIHRVVNQPSGRFIFSGVTLVTVERTEDQETKCILVDSEEHTYVTDDFIVTHNTSATTGFAASAATYKCDANNNRGFKVLHFFFEDEEVNIERKYYGYVLDIDACELSNPNVRPTAIARLNEDTEIKRMLKENIVCKRLSTGEVTASSLKGEIKRQIANGFIPDLVIVDYFECLAREKNNGQFKSNESEWTGEAITMRKLEATCKELNVAMWVPVQGTKGSIGESYVGLMHAGGSVTKTQIGHVVIQFAQTKDQKTQGIMNVFIGKLRAVRIDRDEFLNIKFNNGTCKFDMSSGGSEIDNIVPEQPQYPSQNGQVTAARVATDAKRR